ncbi:hypothetical protein Tco_1405037 [Tanacetum coccineum]
MSGQMEILDLEQSLSVLVFRKTSGLELGRIYTVKFAGRCGKCQTLLCIASAYRKPSQSDSHETIVVAHLDGNHYIRVALPEGFPLPLTHPLWITYRSDIASGWEDKFVSHSLIEKKNHELKSNDDEKDRKAHTCAHALEKQETFRA